MKRNYANLILINTLILFTSIGFAQQTRLASPERHQIDWDICIYTPTDELALINNARREFVRDRMENRITPCSTFNITYGSGFASFPQAQAAFQFAADIWANLIESPVEIRITANFDPASPGNLGSAGSDGFFTLTGPGIPANTLYPAALTEAIIGEDVDGPGGTSNDINANFNSNRSDWYFGTDANPPAGQFDFVSVVLHELGHGLGVLGFGRQLTTDPTLGAVRFGSDASIWDNFIDGQDIFTNPVSILDTSLPFGFPDPSAQLLTQFESGNLTINSTLAVMQNGGVPPSTYAPSTFNSGSSYSHLDETTFNGTPHALMTPFGAPGEANHDPGDIILAFMEDMGWPLCQRTFSTNDFALDDITISPNPFTETITVELPPQLSNEQFSASIIDINGREVFGNIDSNNGEITISNLSSLKNALYFITIESTTSSLSITRKIIKN